MYEEYCNCAMYWNEGMCHHMAKQYVDEYGYPHDGDGYFEIFNEYISKTKNDKVLLKFLKENYDGYYCCYLNIAIFLIKQIYEDYEATIDRGLKYFLMRYLYWSYGLPYDENNKLRRNLEGIEMQNKCYCSDTCKYKICNTYIKNLIREDGTLYNKNDEIYLEMFKEYISMKKNDRVLFDFIKENFEKYKMCYFDIAILMMWKIYDHFGILMRKDIIIFMISYLYWSYGSPIDDKNILKTYFENKRIKNASVMHGEVNKIKGIKQKKSKKEKTTIKIYENKTVKATMNRRVTQSPFRKKLINKYGCCQICGMDILGLLRASHSKPFNKCNVKESIDEYNGLLLCPGHDGVYDGGYIGFNDDGSIILSKYLSEENKKRFNINNDIKIELEPEHSEYLEYHRNHVFRK